MSSKTSRETCIQRMIGVRAVKANDPLLTEIERERVRLQRADAVGHLDLVE